MTYQQLYRKACQSLLAAFPQTATFEGAQLFTAVTGLPTHQLPLRGTETAPLHQEEQMEALLRRRLAREPLQYLLGEWEFFGLPLAVGPGVLIPRADTEIVVETALSLLKGRSSPTIADLCSGSGAIALALWQNLPDAQVTAAELSPEALPYLRKNIAVHCQGSHRPVLVQEGDVLAGLPLPPLDLLISNPPYIAREEMAQLEPEVLLEPHMALEAPEDGQLFYRVLPKLYRDTLKPGGWMVFEVGHRQADAVAEFLRENGYEKISFAKDLAGIRRCVYGQRPL